MVNGAHSLDARGYRRPPVKSSTRSERPDWAALARFYLAVLGRAGRAALGWFGWNAQTVFATAALWGLGIAVSVPALVVTTGWGFFANVVVLGVLSPLLAALLFLLVNLVLEPAKLHRDMDLELARLRRQGSWGKNLKQTLRDLATQYELGRMLLDQKSLGDRLDALTWSTETRDIIRRQLPDAEAFVFGRARPGIGTRWRELMSPWKPLSERLAKLRELIVRLTKPQTRPKTARPPQRPAAEPASDKGAGWSSRSEWIARP